MKLIIDAHCHLTDPRIASELDAEIGRGTALGISQWILGGVDADEWGRQLALIQRYPGKFVPVFGLHPWTVAKRSEVDLEAQWKKLESIAPIAHALGETGLDLAPRWVESAKKQLIWFTRHVDLAARLQKPLVLHVVRAHSEALEVLAGGRKLGGIVHAFTGDAPTARKYLQHGFVASIGARVTYPKSTALRDFVKKADLQEFVIETDCPDQPPSGHPSPIHGPESLFQIARVIADLRARESVEEILAASARNLVNIFAL